jgi:hypothetical protein
MCLSGLYSGSYTWFEACIYRLSADGSYMEDSEEAIARVEWESQDDLLQAGITQVTAPVSGERAWLIQRNARASQELRQHTVTWTDTDATVSETESDDDTGRGQGARFIRSLVAGDRIAVHIRALVKKFSVAGVS